MITKAFNSFYRKLNTAQKEAVDSIDGPVMVIAGPGTGKTQILTLRIANIIRKTDTTPDSILALTFTESGVFSMRKRLVEIMGSEGYRVHIHTFHGFCNDIIRRFPDAFPSIIGSRNINDVDKITLLKEIILTTPLKKLRPFGDNFYYVNHLRQKISELKRENTSPKELKNNIKREQKAFTEIDDLYYDKGVYKDKMKGKYRSLEKKLQKNTELVFVYEEYQKVLKKEKLYDYDDMIIETIQTLSKNTDLLLEIQEEYQYVLADEHQDANNSQNTLLELLVNYHDNPNLFIVGDEKQAIFRFQGASLDNFLYFKKRFPKALLITLEENYRSGQHILDSAHSLILKSSEGDNKLRKPLKANVKERENSFIELRTFSNNDYEHMYVAESIQKKIDEGVPAQEIAVLYRNNKDADALIRVLEKTDVPFVIESPQSVLADIDIRKFILILKAINDFGNDGLLLPTLHIDFVGVDNLDIYKVVRYAQKIRTPLFGVLKSKKILKQAGVEHVDVLHSWYTKLSSWKKVAHNKTLLSFFEIVLHESGFLEYVLSHTDAGVKLEKVNGFFDDLKALVENHHEYTLTDFIDYLQLVEENNIFIKKDSRTPATDRVRLMTAHRSKGLEFEYVYIIGVRDTHWGNKRSIEHFPTEVGERDTFDANDDERRLFYVALTRARTSVSVSFAKEGERGGLQLPSQFIEEIDKKYIKDLPISLFEKSIKKESMLSPKKDTNTLALQDKTFLNELFLEQGLSVTALNNYLKCPWSYFYSNLLRIPKSPNKHMLLGTAIHNTLNDIFNRIAKGEKIEKKTIDMLFETYLQKQPLSLGEYEETLEKGIEALRGYFAMYHREWGGETLTEFKVHIILPVETLPEGQLTLRGTLDKMEIVNTSGEVNVVDYKTGKPKTRNVIEGKTKSSDGNYKRQLVFYKVLLDLYDKGRFTMSSGEIDFVEPDEKGKYHKEKFVITDENTEDLKKVIKGVSKEIYDLSFWNSKCDDAKCRYCDLRAMM